MYTVIKDGKFLFNSFFQGQWCDEFPDAVQYKNVSEAKSVAKKLNSQVWKNYGYDNEQMLIDYGVK